MNQAADFFDVDRSGQPPADLPVITPVRSVPLDPDIDGAWFVTGDIDGDGEIEIVTARNYIDDEVPPNVTSVVARKLDGSILWQWGDTAAGGFRLGYDVACQIHDWDGDGKLEVILLTRGEIVELEGATGKERRRIPIDPDATDCLAFADLAGAGRRGELIYKDRYYQTWAMDYSGKELWTVRFPGGWRTAHQPYPIDIDGDGRDEVVVGYALVGPEGEIRWTFEPPEFDEPLGHLDCCRIFRRGETPADWRLVITPCGHRGLVMIDGEGRKLWELVDDHYESIDIGHIDPDSAEPRIVIDVALARGEHVIMIVDGDGCQLGQMHFKNPRFHMAIDVLGLGHDQIVQPDSRGIFNHRGDWLARLDLPAKGDIIQRGDMTGNGRVGFAISTGDAESGNNAIHLFEFNHDHAVKTATLGCGENFTLY
jgi:hypothetical protein